MSKNTKGFDVWRVITIVFIALYALFLLYPLIMLLSKSVFNSKTGAFTLEHFQKFFGRKYYYSAVFNSLKVTIAVTFCAILVSTPLAYVLSTVKIKGKQVIQILILMTSLSAPFIGAYSWVLLLGRNGVVTNFLKDSLGIAAPDIYGFKGILLVLTLQLTPLIYMYISGALKNMDSSLLEAAESMGCSGIRKIFKVVIPLILPTVLAASLLIFMRALADFGTPMLIGEGYRTVPVLIFTEFISETGGDDNFAAAISVVVVVFATAIFLAQKYVSNKKSFSMSALRPIEAKKVTGWKNFLAHAYVYVYVFIAVMPQMYVIYTSFKNTDGRIFVEGHSLANYQNAFSKMGNAITNTLVLALVSIAIILVMAVLIAYVILFSKQIVLHRISDRGEKSYVYRWKK